MDVRTLITHSPPRKRDITRVAVFIFFQRLVLYLPSTVAVSSLAPAAATPPSPRGSAGFVGNALPASPSTAGADAIANRSAVVNDTFAAAAMSLRKAMEHNFDETTTLINETNKRIEVYAKFDVRYEYERLQDVCCAIHILTLMTCSMAIANIYAYDMFDDDCEYIRL